MIYGALVKEKLLARSSADADSTIGAADVEAAPRLWVAGTLTYTRRSLVRLFVWLLWGDLAWNVRDRALGELMKVFMRHVQASNRLISILTNVVPSIINFPLQPTIAFWSDRHRGPAGRRRPFLLVGVPLAGLCIVGMGLSPMIGTWVHGALGIQAWHIRTTIIGCFAVFFLIYDVASVTSGAVFNAFFNDVVPHELLGRFFGFVRAVSIGVMIIFMMGVLGYAEKYLTPIFVAVGITYGIGFTSAVLAVKEGTYPPPQEMGPSAGPFTKMWRGMSSYARICFTEPFYLWVFAATLLPQLAFSSIYTWAQFFATQKGIDLSLDNYAKLTGLYFILSLPLAPLQGWLADKIHPLRVALIVMALHVPACLWGWFCVGNGTTFAIAYVLTGLLQVLYNTAVSALWPRILRKDAFAQLSSASALIHIPINMTYGYFLAWLLDFTHSNYRYTFLLAGVLSIVAMAVLMVLYRKFMKLGGADHYVAP
jgi:MFS family permease